MPDLTGHSIGRYHIVEQIGQGGMATVYKAFDTRLERDVALKIIRTDQFGQAVLDRILKRFEREAKLLARLTHPNIVHINDFGDHEGTPYLVMDYLPGGTLKLRLGEPMDWRLACRTVIPVAEALIYAHEQGLIHRDVKPSNILLTHKGQPMLTDFGIAKILETDDTTALTGTGVGMGTPEYMAPEQWTGNAGPASDIYSLGVVLYELVTGHKPYTADTPAAILLKQATEPLPRPRKFAPNLPDAMEKAIFKALAKKPEDRFSSMAEFAIVLEKLERTGSLPVIEPKTPASSVKRAKDPGGEPTVDLSVRLGTSQSAPEPLPLPAALPKRTSTRLWMGIALGVLLLAFVAVFLVWQGKDLMAGLLATKAQTLTSAPTITISPQSSPTPTLIPTPALGIGSTMTREKDLMIMVYVPAGPFTMGSNDGENDEKPPHQVNLDAFWIDQTEVTNAEYALCVKSDACTPPSDTKSYTQSSYYGNSSFADFPVIYVDWIQADTYCRWAEARLPTEAEWEKAARGTDGRNYPWGEGLGCSQANYWGKDKACQGDTSKVGSYPQGASPYGALDMIGNVWEWSSDWYDIGYYDNSPKDNPQGPSLGDSRVVRGGSWYFNVNLIHSAYRDWYAPSVKVNYLGFRCVLGTSP